LRLATQETDQQRETTTNNQRIKMKEQEAGLQYHVDGMDDGREARSRSTIANVNVNAKPAVPQFLSRTAHDCHSAILITAVNVVLGRAGGLWSTSEALGRTLAETIGAFANDTKTGMQQQQRDRGACSTLRAAGPNWSPIFSLKHSALLEGQEPEVDCPVIVPGVSQT
jgi:hypothetical protein